MLEEFKKHIKNQFPHLGEHPFLIACSAGLDSTVLAYLCHRIGLDFQIAHCNFKLRGAESDEDEHFVRGLANKLKKNIHVTHFDTIGYMNKNKVSLQMAARELRYYWFAEIMKQNALGPLVTAHHADDNLETYIINLSRGTGIDGLLGIPFRTHSISRPLLEFSREDILGYAKAEGLEWREESTNSETKYLRNKIRHNIVPILKELHPTFLDNFKKTQEHLNEIAQLAENHIDKIRQEIFERKDNHTRIKIGSLKSLIPIKAYLYHLFKEFGFAEWNTLEQLLTASSGKQLLSHSHRLVKDREYLLLTEIVDNNNEVHLIHEDDELVHTPIKLHIKKVDTMKERGENVLYVDKETLKYPLTLRKWRKGDYFYPLGMIGKKKLSKYFKDEKVDMISKEKQWLVCSDDQIVWVVGRRMDERFKIRDTTRTIIQIKNL